MAYWLTVHYGSCHTLSDKKPKETVRLLTNMDSGTLVHVFMSGQ